MPAFDFHPQAVTYPKGFRSAGARGGLKTSGPDVALIVADVACEAAAVFTTTDAALAGVARASAEARDLGGHLSAVRGYSAGTHYRNRPIVFNVD